MTGPAPTTPPAPATDAATAAALRRLELTVARRVDGLLHGDVAGLAPGQGSESGESRVYVPGDDVRRLDWPLTARTTVPHVRETVAERELETWLVVDLSASLDFGTARVEKRDLALAAVAAVGFLTARGGNRTGAVLALPGGPQRLPARPGRDAVRALLARLARAPRQPPGPAGPVLGPALERLARGGARRGLVVVVSDLLDPVAGWERPLRVLGARHELLVVELVDPREAVLPDVGVVVLTDPETGAQLEVQTRSRRTRQRYAQAAAARRAAVAAAVRRAGGDHLVLSTDSDWLDDLVRHVLRRRRLRASGARASRAGAGSTP